MTKIQGDKNTNVQTDIESFTQKARKLWKMAFKIRRRQYTQIKYTVCPSSSDPFYIVTYHFI